MRVASRVGKRSAKTAARTARPVTTTSTSELQLGESLEFLQLLWALVHALQSLSKHMESSLGVTGPQRLVLRIVGRSPGISAGELAHVLRVHPSTLTGVLRRLQERGYLTRTADAADGRRSLFALTRKGRTVDRATGVTAESSVRTVLGRATGTRAAAARGLLHELVIELERRTTAL